MTDRTTGAAEFPVVEFPVVTAILRNVPRQVVESVVAIIDDDGLDLAVEVTRNSPTFTDLPQLVSNHPTVRIGAGTVLTADDARLAIDSGCQFILSPALIPEATVSLCHDAGLLVVPGAFTPTEIQRAVAEGADIVKVFPIREFSANYVRDLQAPLGPLRLMGVGGVTVASIPSLLAQGLRHLGIGSSLLGANDVGENRVREALHSAVAAARSASSEPIRED